MPLVPRDDELASGVQGLSLGGNENLDVEGKPDNFVRPPTTLTPKRFASPATSTTWSVC